MSIKRIYADYASTTPVDKRVLKAMNPYFSKSFGNPSSIYSSGVEAKRTLDSARKKVALCLEAHSDEIIFTSGGTESNNLAIFGVVSALNKNKKNGGNTDLRAMHIVTTNIEHSSVLEPIRELEKSGVSVTYVPVEQNGIVDPGKIEEALRPETVLVSVAYANNEIGTIQPLREISKRIRNFPPVKGQRSNVSSRPYFHCDASQAPLYLGCTPEHLGVDLLTLDGHKMYGPKGVGMLYVRRGTEISPIILGGGQERGLRSTTENVPLVVGFSTALELAIKLRKKESERLTAIRNKLHSDVLKNIRMLNREIVLNGDLEKRLPNNLNISIPGISSEFAVLRLDVLGVECSTKSSCLGSAGGSYVIEALGGDKGRSTSSFRFTFGRGTTKSEISKIVSIFKKVVEELSR